VAEVPTIRIVFQNTFPQLAGQVGTLTMTSLDGEGTLVGLQELTYIPGATVDILYPGTTVNADGSIADVPGWILQPNGLWVRDPSDEFLRLGILLTYTVNPTATAVVTYPPESATCANPENPPGGTPTTPPPGLPSTGSDSGTYLAIATLALGTGLALFSVGRKRRRA
jgi:LPXTG-motif cell wall-anchored protein